jgi:hypothetical protein
MDIRTKFKYPTDEEFQIIQNKNPTIKNFGFLVVSPWKFRDNSEFIKYDHLSQWDHQLHNWIADFNSCYMYVLVNFNRGTPLSTHEMIENETLYINYININFYLKYLLLCFDGINNNILNILNIYYGCNLNESGITKTNLSKKLVLSNPDINEIIDGYYKQTNKLLELRRSIAHRFDLLQIDNRAKVINENKIEMPFNNNIPDYTNYIEIVEASILDLKQYIKTLASKMKITVNP